MIRTQDDVALTSIEGIAFVAFLTQQGRVLAEEPIELIFADAGFDDLPLAKYTVVVKHECVEPPEVAYDVTINAPDDVFFLKFIYLEPERVFLQIQAAVEKRL
ncbi:MAG: hypothetical protein HC769_09920 [Cyanobacteria bacterium CRU_2_1]|nr:hypothetical protein [Cyanobacteria bacterium RU_5_0]NJR59130.1 hypothetical protein [Cyanobacteria bacterium CRU_2_1]